MVPPPRGSCTQQGGTRAQEESWAAGSLGTEPAGEASAAPASPCTPGEGHQQPREGDGDRADPSRPSPCPPLSLHEPPRVQLPCSQSPKTQKTHTLVHTHTSCSQTLTLTHTHTHVLSPPHTHTFRYPTPYPCTLTYSWAHTCAHSHPHTLPAPLTHTHADPHPCPGGCTLRVSKRRAACGPQHRLSPGFPAVPTCGQGGGRTCTFCRARFSRPLPP